MFPILFFLKNPLLLLGGASVLTSVSGWYIYNNLNLSPAFENDYLFRIKLANLDGSKSIGGKSINFSDANQKKALLEEDRKRLTEFYRKYSSKAISVNTSDSMDFYLHLKNQRGEDNLNSLWMEYTHLNQLSIDRYGFDYDAEGIKKDNPANLKELVKWQNLDLSGLKYEPFSKTRLENISFNFFNQDISKEEIDILINEEESKYKTDDYTSRDWFVWLDKDLLVLKANYAIRTYVFNQVNAKSQRAIQEIIGQDLSTSTDTQKKKKALIANNYEKLGDEYKQFAEDYISLFVAKVTSSSPYINWINVVSEVMSSEQLITSKDLNRIYNKFSKDKKNLSIFQNHLLTKITAGRIGNWKISLDLLKEGKSPFSPDSTFESRLIEKSDNRNDNDRNRIRIHMDPDTNPDLKINKIYELLTQYSSRYFSIQLPDSTDVMVSADYSNSVELKNKELIHAIKLKNKNEFSLS